MAALGIFENQNNVLQTIFQQFGMAQQEMERQKNFGPQSRIPSLCSGYQMGGEIQVGKKTEQSLTTKLNQDSHDYNANWKRIVDIEKYNSGKKLEDIVPSSHNCDVSFF